MAKLVIVRHGQSQANRDNIFTGWTDVPLTEKGIEQGQMVGDELARMGIQFDDAHTCLLYTSPSPRDRQKSRMPSSA